MEKAVYLLILIILASCSKDKKVDHLGDYVINNTELGISFPPVENKSERKSTLSILADINVKKIRFAEAWSFREPTDGNYSWGPLDDRINWATEAGYDVLLTIQSNGPDWACSTLANDNSCVFDTLAFKGYIEYLLQRYPNKIAKIQFGNEWQSDFWYIGTAEEFCAANNILYTAVQDYSPSTEVVLGGFTTISLRFLAGCAGKIESFYDDEGILYDKAYLDANCGSSEGIALKERIEYVLTNAKYDILDLHFYDDVENWGIYYNHFKTLTTKPILVSEFGGPNSNYEDDSDENQAARLYDYIATLDSLEVYEAYYFKLVQGTKNEAHIKSGLMKGASKTKKRSYFVFKRFTD